MTTTNPARAELERLADDMEAQYHADCKDAPNCTDAFDWGEEERVCDFLAYLNENGSEVICLYDRMTSIQEWGDGSTIMASYYSDRLSRRIVLDAEMHVYNLTREDVLDLITEIEADAARIEREVRTILSPQRFAALVSLVEYTHDDEQKHYEEQGGEENTTPHIFNDIKVLSDFIEAVKHD